MKHIIDEGIALMPTQRQLSTPTGSTLLVFLAIGSLILSQGAAVAQEPQRPVSTTRQPLVDSPDRSPVPDDATQTNESSKVDHTSDSLEQREVESADVASGQPFPSRLNQVSELSSLAADEATNVAVPQSQETRSNARDRRPPDKDFANQFWVYLLSNNYKHWSPFPEKPVTLFLSRGWSRFPGAASRDNPHTDQSKVYMNRTAASNPLRPPVGSVLVMENYRRDRSLQSISVMYRTEGFHPKANDWYWVNYNPDGSVTDVQELRIANAARANAARPNTGDPEHVQATFVSNRTKPIRLKGRTRSCIACHGQAGNQDFAFFNDRPSRSNERPPRSGIHVARQQ